MFFLLIHVVNIGNITKQRMYEGEDTMILPQFFSKNDRAEPRGLEDFLAWVRQLNGEVTCIKKFPARSASYNGFAGLDRRIADALKESGIASLYSHQSQAVSSAMAGRDIVIVTPTASGKTLCYNLPVMEAALKDSSARALYLFPTKALAQDQLAELERFSRLLLTEVRAYTYDGDTPQQRRSEARERGSVIITNPDMLSSGILPHHTSWADFFRNLKYIVVDELHTYRGVFGSHMANLFSRLIRVCEFYGASPVFICCSATIANPSEHAAMLTGRRPQLISENGAPSSEKNFMIYNPPIVDKHLGVRRSSIFEVSRLAAEALMNEISTIVFTRSRLNVELLLKLIRKELSVRGGDPNSVTGYRGGYLPKERREIEQGLRKKELLGVISTNALELGIDIGSLELALLHGYPGSIASAWQQIGRAGRRGKVSASIMVPSALAMDQFLAANPDWFLGAPSELARIDPYNPYIQVGHIKCSAFELPFHEEDTFGGRGISVILDYLAEHRLLQKCEDREGVLYKWQAPSYPAAELSLRSATGDVYTITDISDEKRPRTIGNMDRHSAPTMLYPEAIYFHAGESYIVESLNRENLQCLVRLSGSDYYTEAESTVRIEVTEEFERKGPYGWGEVILAVTPYLFTKIRISTHEKLGHGEIKAEEEEMTTTACWITIPSEFTASTELKTAMDGLQNLMKNAAPLFLMCDRDDIQIHGLLNDVFLKQPAIFLADNIPGGVGLAEGAYEMGDKLLRSCLEIMDICPCENGCPACVGIIIDNYDVKNAVKRLISAVIKSGR